MKQQKRKNRKLVAIITAILMMCTWTAGAFAETVLPEGAPTEPTHRLSAFTEEMVVGEVETEASVKFYSLTGSSFEPYASVEADNLIVESLNPEIVTAEVKAPYPSSPDMYCIVLTGISTGVGTVRIVYSKNNNPNLTAIAEAQITVIGQDQAVIADFPGDRNLNKGDTILFDRSYNATIGEKFSDFINTDEHFAITSSNPAVVEVRRDDSLQFADQYLKAVGPGSATITMTVVNKEGPINGISKSFNVNVTQGAKATAPVLTTQVAAKYSVYYNRIHIAYKIKDQNATYEVWRSTSPNKNFKKVGTIKVQKSSINGYMDVPSWGSMEPGSKAYFDDFSKKYPVKANTKYYYKMRVKYTDEYFDNSWSKWSKVQAYWTSPKPIADKKVKYNRNTRKVTFPKQNIKMTGYIYTASGVKFLGYNIFGGKVYYSANSTRFSTKRTFKVANVEGMKPSNVDTVIPYVKHGKYYYAHGYDLVKSPKKYKKTEGHKWSK